MLQYWELRIQIRRLFRAPEAAIYNLEDHILKKLLLLTFTLMCVVFAQTQVHAADVKTVKETIVKHAIEMGVDPAIALSLARAESGFRHEAKSAHGAVGVYQLMPSTARKMGLNPYSLNDNIKGGIMYYKMMYNMFGSMELALAAYNAGPGNVKKFGSVPPYAETKRFVSAIMADYNRQKANPDPAVVSVKQQQAQQAKPPVQQVKPPETPPAETKEVQEQPAETTAI